jgi:hypothetical protein
VRIPVFDPLLDKNKDLTAQLEEAKKEIEGLRK